MAQIDVSSIMGGPVFKTYMVCSGVLVTKMMFMSSLTAQKRIQNKAFANPEDCGKLDVQPKVDENVERVRRAHLNDLENIPLFFVSAFMYTMTDPPEQVAKTLLLTYTGARILHTFVYAIYVLPQPSRGLFFGVGFFITGYMAVKGILHFL